MIREAIQKVSDVDRGESAKKIQTDFPSIVKVKDICRSKAIIEGTRITVRHIVVMLQSGDSVDDILQVYPHLKSAQVHDAIRYYHDYRNEIEREIKENRIENVLKEYDAIMDERGIVHFPNRRKKDVSRLA